MKETTTFTVLESAITISGKLIVFLNSFDIEIPVGSRLIDVNGNQWTITGSSKIFNTTNTQIKKKIIELGAVEYFIESSTHIERLKVGDHLILK